MTATMYERLCVSGVFLSAFIFHGFSVLGAVFVVTPPYLSVTVHRDTLLLECTFWTTAQSEKVTKITWSRNGVYDRGFKTVLEIPIPYTGDGKVLYRDSSLKSRSTLHVIPGDERNTTIRLEVKPNCGDHGLYRCEANSEGGSQQTTAVVNVTILEAPKIVSLVQGSKFECTAALGSPTGSLTWILVRREGNHLRNMTMGGMTSQDHGHSFCSEVTQSSLHTDVSGDDEKIICIVTSPTTSVSKELSISVPYAVKNARISSLVGGKEMADWVKDVSAFVGDEVVLNCSARGRPRPNYKWRHLLTSEKDWALLNTSGMPSLTIKNVSIEEAGKYICFAENNVGGAVHSISKEIHLTVKARLQQTAGIDPKEPPNTVILIVIFVGILTVGVSVGVCILLICTSGRRRDRRRRNPINHVELEYRPVVRNPSSRRSISDSVPPRARDDFNI